MCKCETIYHVQFISPKVMESAPVTLTHLPEADDTRATLNQRLLAYHGGPAFDRLLREWRYQNHILGDVAKVLDEKA